MTAIFFIYDSNNFELDSMQLQLYSRGSQRAAPRAPRFYTLFAFWLLSFNQSLFWITCSPIVSNAKEEGVRRGAAANLGGKRPECGPTFP